MDQHTKKLIVVMSGQVMELIVEEATMFRRTLSGIECSSQTLNLLNGQDCLRDSESDVKFSMIRL